MTQEPRQGRQRRRLTATVTDLEVDRQKALLVGVVTKRDSVADGEASLDELARLTDTAGSEPVHSMLVRRDAPDAALYVGKGKANEIASDVAALDIDVVVFDNELSPAQGRNLNERFHVDVVDRTALILDIFAQHASSKEGMLQVELAQHRYRLPRLRGKGIQLSRLGGGIGTRGPGETQLETDRRRILDRVRKIEKQLKDSAGSRQTRSKARRRQGLPLIALVGYTNAGKSTLFNALTAADVLVEDQLFATLDSTVRKLEMPGGAEALASDTVGFVRRLPHQLVESFRATLEEVQDADLLVHVVDAAEADPESQAEAVRSVLHDIGAGELPELVVFNKMDIAPPAVVSRLLEVNEGSVAVSAAKRRGLNELLDAVATELSKGSVDVDLLIPYSSGDIVDRLYRVGEVIERSDEASGTRITARIPAAELPRFAGFSSD
ncbi:MAG: GTPase HflX [bacterium]|nr:GTPase HflX [bacterium]